jgi:hypothetical protein
MALIGGNSWKRDDDLGVPDQKSLDNERKKKDTIIKELLELHCVNCENSNTSDCNCKGCSVKKSITKIINRYYIF